jgi:hypothetical protein
LIIIHNFRGKSNALIVIRWRRIRDWPENNPDSAFLAKVFHGCTFFATKTSKNLDARPLIQHNGKVITKNLMATTTGIRSSKVPCGRKRKKHKIATHKRKKQLRMNRHKKK